MFLPQCLSINALEVPCHLDISGHPLFRATMPVSRSYAKLSRTHSMHTSLFLYV
jgi:hypothetical protein